VPLEDRRVPEDSDPDDSLPTEPATGRPPSEVVDDTPTVTCTRCDRTWDLGYELDELSVGNQAVEQFALDHRRHTGHFPDGVATWRAECRRCPEGSEHLAEHGARRWAETHARHTRHEVALHHTETETTVVEADDAGHDADQKAGDDDRNR
jgi:hypothetical protein